MSMLPASNSIANSRPFLSAAPIRWQVVELALPRVLLTTAAAMPRLLPGCEERARATSKYAGISPSCCTIGLPKGYEGYRIFRRSVTRDNSRGRYVQSAALPENSGSSCNSSTIMLGGYCSDNCIVFRMLGVMSCGIRPRNEKSQASHGTIVQFGQVLSLTVLGPLKMKPVVDTSSCQTISFEFSESESLRPLGQVVTL